MDAKKASLTRDEVVKSFSICDNTQSGFIAIKRLKVSFRCD
jgi:Ca2+-binding EF-hand superfamily protein